MKNTKDIATRVNYLRLKSWACNESCKSMYAVDVSQFID